MTASGQAASLEVQGPQIKLSNAERARETDRHIATMKTFLTKSIDISGAARRDKDVVRLNCIQEKITALKALLRVGEQASVAVQEAVSRNEADTANYELQRVRLASAKAQQMSAEANSCVGEVAVYTGPVQMVVETDPDLPRKDPTLAREPVNRVEQFPMPNLLDRPQALSPPM